VKGIKPEVARRVKGHVASLRLHPVVGGFSGGVAAPRLPTFDSDRQGFSV